MSEIIYEIVEHDGGWSYRANGVYSETFATREIAARAAEAAAARQQQAGRTNGIVFQDKSGTWHHEIAKRDDRPVTRVES